MSAFPQVDRLRDALRGAFPLLSEHVDRAFAAFGSPWAIEVEEFLARCLAEPASLEQAAKGYSDFVLDGTRLMKRFEKAGVYAAKTYAEAAAQVYHNPQYMSEVYLPGTLLSHYLWVHHYRQLLFVRSGFAADLARSNDPRFYEVGLGSGFYSRVLLGYAPQARGIGFDISDSSIAYSRRHVAAYGYGDRYDIRKTDILTEPVPEPAPFLLCIEVLEHLESPPAFLRALRSMLAPGGKAVISAAINAPNADHIYLYRDAEEVHRQLRGAGFRLEQALVLAAYRPRADEPVPMIAAFIVT